jgi:neutral ceramidase
MKDYGSLMSSYPYPVEVWRLGNQAIFALGGELVVQYAVDLKKIFGQDIFVLGYVNDDMAYIPTEAILSEGGYEGESSMMVYGLPSKWETGLQSKILAEMRRLALKTGVNELSK